MLKEEYADRRNYLLIHQESTIIKIAMQILELEGVLAMKNISFRVRNFEKEKFLTFNIDNDAELDEELFVRWAQANSLMGMMQISIAPWRVLSDENANRVIAAIKLHESFGEKLVDLAKNAKKTGEPIVRHMAYEFPDEGLEEVSGQFMLGSDILVAPILKKGECKKRVMLPHGMWQSSTGEIYSGDCEIIIDVDMDTTLYFRRCS